MEFGDGKRGGQRREIEKRDREARACPRRRKQRRDFASRQGSERQQSKKRRRFLIGLLFLFDTQLRLTPNQQAPAPFSPSECDAFIDRCASRGQQEQKAERIWQLARVEITRQLLACLRRPQHKKEAGAYVGFALFRSLVSLSVNDQKAPIVGAQLRCKSFAIVVRGHTQESDSISREEESLGRARAPE